jgi:hypothetical protein
LERYTINIISGMHRSGTSLVAQMFAEAGADLGNVDSFYRADKWNQDGYFEQPDIQDINMSLIHGFWWKFAYFRLPSTDTILKRSLNLENQIKRVGDRYFGRVVKETRFCLTLPAWRKYVEIDKIIICIREPMQVVRSIQKRNKTSAKHAFSLWYLHNYRILENSKGIPIWFVHYNHLLSKQHSFLEVKAAFDFFGYDFSDSYIKKVCEKCIKPEMNHAPVEKVYYPPEVSILWKQLLEQHNNQYSNIFKPL